jgi:hypothetical protein
MRFFQFVASIIEDSFLIFWILVVISIAVFFFSTKKTFYHWRFSL